jgi:hypothetical protein
MFSYTGLSEEQVLTIRARHHIYMLRSGRISMSGCKYITLILYANTDEANSELLKRHPCGLGNRRRCATQGAKLIQQ